LTGIFTLFFTVHPEKCFDIYNNNNNNNTHVFIVLSSTAPATCESSLWFIWAKVGYRQVAANSQAKLQTSPLSPPVGCYRPNIRPSPLVLLLNRKVDTHLLSLGGWKAEST